MTTVTIVRDGELVSVDLLELEPPAILPDPVPPSISDRQFFQELANEGRISQAEALAAVKTGTIPTTLQGFIDTIANEKEQFAAEMLLSGATNFHRDHPLTATIGAAQGMNSADIDNFFRAASAL